MAAPRHRALVVEDAGTVLDLLGDALTHAGLEVDVRTAADAVDRLAAHRNALIIPDCVLPDLPALDWLAALRGVAPGTPLVVYSGSIRLEELRGHAADFGAAAVLEKPFSPARLVEAIRGAVGPGDEEGRGA